MEQKKVSKLSGSLTLIKIDCICSCVNIICGGFVPELLEIFKC